jgi:hypothetical protein
MDTEKEQHTFEKYEKDNKIAVLYSPGYGAGWHSWNTGNQALLFDKDLVKFVLNDDIKGLKEHIENNEQKYGNPYLGGAKQLKVKWLTKGTQFEIEEYDGSETIHIIGERKYHTA